MVMNGDEWWFYSNGIASGNHHYGLLEKLPVSLVWYPPSGHTNCTARAPLRQLQWFIVPSNLIINCIDY